MTTAIANPVRQRIAQGGVALGVGVRVARGVEIAKLMKVAGFDWLFIDLEHGQMSIDAACQMSVAALDAGIAPLVRVPMGQLTMGTRCLDGGALGIVMPHVLIRQADDYVLVHWRLPCAQIVGTRRTSTPCLHLTAGCAQRTFGGSGQEAGRGCL